MSLWRQLSRGLSVLAHRSRADQEIDAELQHYLDEATDAYVGKGLSAADARRAARREIGSPAAARERVRDSGWENVIVTALADLRFGGRMLRKNPLFTFVVVFVIALGCGGVTTVFSGMNAIVLRPVPGVASAAALVTLRPARGDGRVADQGSYNLYSYLRAHSRTLDAVGAWGRVSLTIAADGRGAAVIGNMVSANYFDALGIRPARGRFFAANEDQERGAHPVIVVSHGFWQAHLHGDPAAVGRLISVNRMPFTLIGIAPHDFRGIYTGLRIDAWVPLAMQPVLRPRSNLTDAAWLWLFGRMHEGMTIKTAQEELSLLAKAQAAESSQPYKPESAPTVRVDSFTGLPNGEGRALLGFMALLLGAAGLVLLIAGVNVAGLLSARYEARQRELAVRAALGAGRSRLLRHLLTEVLLLFTLGAIGGFLFAVAATAALEQLPLPQNVPVSLELSPDLRVFAFSLAVALLTGLACGIAPALRHARGDITARLRADSTSGGRRRGVMSQAMVVLQLAFSLVLLVAAGLFVRALNHGQRIDPGFDVTAVSTASLEPEAWGYDGPQARMFYRVLRDRLVEAPGVLAVSYTGRLPLMMGSSPEAIGLNGSTLTVHTASVDIDYFAALQLPLLRGRAFRSSDDEHSIKVAVVNDTLARQLWPDGTALGRTFDFRGERTVVIGVARDAKYATLDESTPPFVYFPLAQRWQPTQALVVRTAGDPRQSARLIADAMRAIDSRLPAPRVATLREATGIVLLPQRAAAIVTGALGAIGLALAAVGLYGIMAFSAARRTHEIGIRLALGADRWNVLRALVRDGFVLAVAGVALGLLLAATATRLLAAWLFDISPLDGPTYMAMSSVFLAISALATYLPVRRAAAADPLTSLRAD